ncbi:bifunctional diguanylate cyclase/phosphodiesterase [uncultured Roseovarius sp.]|uniref:putative bifunctional diguanylate cyclase/phosphodiesterase n=1 Tax=uncultured Roseovarius sp. TaxID=293344 RepID=UPI00260F6946|nr:bifunctional diguanylate cyclase/phosphodiesterase [uncultured Roseovarius sp.]
MDRDSYHFSQDTMALLFPMYVTLDATGRIEDHGPTLSHIFTEDITDRMFFDVFTVEKPRRIADLDALHKRTGVKLVITARPDHGEPIQFRSVAMRMDDDAGRLFLDFSIGVSLADAIKRFDLTGAHFRPNDFSIDLFYTFETQRALLDDSTKMARALTSAKEDAERKAYIDSVTGIANRRALYIHLEEILKGPKSGDTYALLHLDLDKFKLLNDTFGHAAGDTVLKHAATAMQARIGPADLAARIGGDEFAMVFRENHETGDLEQLAQNLAAEISRPVPIDGHRCNVEVSIGIIRFRAGDTDGADRLLMNSDIALYEAKRHSTPVMMLTPEMIRTHQDRLYLIAEIEDGLEDNQFVPFFQPQIDLGTGQICGVEALARWDHPQLGILPPGRFLETAIRANLMGRIDRMVRRKAIDCLAAWRRDGIALGKLSLNVTASNLRSADFVEDFQDELFIAGLIPGDIQIELLESILFDQTDKLLVDHCHALKEAGFVLALDDFGTGHASISTLIDTPISMLKIDRSFVSGIDRHPRMQSISGSFLAMAEHLGLSVMAEGVETPEELNILHAQGCQLFQGYHFSPPRAQDDIIAWTRDWMSAQGKMARRRF